MFKGFSKPLKGAWKPLVGFGGIWWYLGCFGGIWGVLAVFGGEFGGMLKVFKGET